MRIGLWVLMLCILRISAQNTPTIVFGRTESRAGNGIAYSVEAAKGYGVNSSPTVTAFSVIIILLQEYNII